MATKLEAFGPSDRGFVMARAVEFQEVAQAAFEAQAGGPVDWSIYTALGAGYTIMGDLLDQVGQAAQAAHDQWIVGNATRHAADAQAMLGNVRRIPASSSKISATLQGTAGKVVPAGYRLRFGGDDGRALWYVPADTVIGDDGNSDPVVLLSVERGAVQGLQTDTPVIVTPLEGWDGATLLESATPGRAEETDDELLLRRQSANQGGGSGGRNATIDHLLQIDGVDAVWIEDNDTDDDKVVAGYTIPPGGMLVVVGPGALTDAARDAVAARLWSDFPGGQRFVGDQVATVYDRFGAPKRIAFSLSTPQGVALLWSVTVRAGYALADVRTALLAASRAHLLALTPGGTVEWLALLGVAAGVPGVLRAAVTINGATDDVTVPATSYPVLDEVGSDVVEA